MTPELGYLVWSVALLIVHIALQASFSDLEKGIGYALGPQDEQRTPKSLVAQRIERSLTNFLQTYPAFIALAVTISIAGVSSTTTALGAAIWFWARIAYIPAYASGVPMVRSLIWFVSIGGLLMMLWPLLIA